MTSTRGWARRRGTTDAWPLEAAICRGVSPHYKDRGADDEWTGTKRFNKEMEGVRERRRRRGVFVGDLETPSSCLIKKLGGDDPDSKNTA